MVFQEAVELRHEERDTFLADACAGDSALRSEVDSLIASHDDERPFLDATPIVGAGKVLAAALADVDDGTAPRLSPGTRIGEYEIIERLGVGGMGEVYRAYDTQLDRFVALKILHDAPGGHTNTRILREARAVSALDHPSISTIYAVGNFEGRSYLAMEYVAGRPLNEILPPGGLPPDDVVKFGIQIASALAHAHERGVIHRDLKSANIVVTPQGRAKVLDFGIARRTLTKEGGSRPPTLTDAGTIAGTPAYMAPELLRNQKADPRSDVWALGVLLHEMACGRRPFEGETTFEITSAILRDSAPPLPVTVPAFLQSTISRCLVRDAEVRVQDAADVVRALETRAIDTFRAASSPRHFLKSPFVLVTIALILFVAGLITSAWRFMRADSRYTPDPQAYELYTRGQAELLPLDDKGTAAAAKSFEAAIARDRNFALAWAGLAKASARMALFYAEEPDVPVWQTAAHRAAQRAVQLRPDIAETHEAVAAVYRSAEFNWAAAIDESTRALRLKPTLDQPHAFRASGFFHFGLFDLADSEADAAMALNPRAVTSTGFCRAHRWPLRRGGTALGACANEGGRMESCLRLLLRRSQARGRSDDAETA
jgi:serine/threonine protein kinase